MLERSPMNIWRPFLSLLIALLLPCTSATSTRSFEANDDEGQLDKTAFLEEEAMLNTTLFPVDDDDFSMDPYARIVGGYQPSRDRFPYFVRVDHNGGLHCGGVLISEDIVLTAAHCIVGSGYYTAYYNAYNTYTSYSGMQARGVTRAIRYPTYSSRTRDNDIAVLKLSSPINNPRLAPVNSNSFYPQAGNGLTVIGVGDAYQGGSSTTYLHQVGVNVVPHALCNANYQGDVNDATMFCARNAGKDSCQGDSGGPIFQTINGVEQVVGIVSWGRGCAQSAYPGVYARTSAVKAWINMMKNQLSPPISRPTTPTGPPPTGSSSDSCSDDPGGTFSILGETRSCTWLQTSPSWISIFCPVPQIGEICRKTCNACKESNTPPTPPPSPGPTPAPVNPTPSPVQPTPAPVQPTPGPTPSPVAPPPASPPAEEQERGDTVPYRADCDDSVDQRFRVNNAMGHQSCIWLKARPEWQSLLCRPDHPAFTTCEETCQACRDTCEDTDRKFKVGDVEDRDCLWLSLRPRIQREMCKAGNGAWNACPETCENCPTDEGGTQKEVVKEESTDPCDDSRRDRFWVNEALRSQPCVWLKARPMWQEALCASPNSAASQVCPETCGVCIDDCEDGSQKFMVNGGARGCLWLSLRPDVQDRVCNNGSNVRNICRETCNNCV